MTSTITRTLWASALFLGLSLGAASARAGEAGKKNEPAKENKSPKETKQAKKAGTGEACKEASDCDQSNGRHACVDNTCKPQIVHPVT